MFDEHVSLRFIFAHVMKSKALQSLQAYGRLVQNITSHTGLDLPSILDIRGNHDDFDVPKRQGKHCQSDSLCDNMSVLQSLDFH